jgi:hypothetical protein
LQTLFGKRFFSELRKHPPAAGCGSRDAQFITNCLLAASLLSFAGRLGKKYSIQN